MSVTVVTESRLVLPLLSLVFCGKQVLLFSEKSRSVSMAKRVLPVKKRQVDPLVMIEKGDESWCESERPIKESPLYESEKARKEELRSSQKDPVSYTTDELMSDTETEEERGGCDECNGSYGECGYCDGVCDCECHQETDCKNCDYMVGLLYEVKQVVSDRKLSMTAKLERLAKLL